MINSRRILRKCKSFILRWRDLVVSVGIFVAVGLAIFGGHGAVVAGTTRFERALCSALCWRRASRSALRRGILHLYIDCTTRRPSAWFAHLRCVLQALRQDLFALLTVAISTCLIRIAAVSDSIFAAAGDGGLSRSGERIMAYTFGMAPGVCCSGAGAVHAAGAPPMI